MIDILLATYNGARHLTGQLDSLSRQTVQDWTLWICDDGSEDGTQSIARRYQEERPEQVHIVESEGHLGAMRNFAHLLAYSKSPYIMFCDQDDIWLPDKIEITLARMKQLEAEHGDRTPLLVHTDMCVVNEKLRPIASSFAHVMNLHPEHMPLQRLLVQNVATGCAMMMNRALADKVGAIPPGARMHDAWIALVAALFGHVAWIGRPTMLYRQHDKNRIGVRNLRKLPKARKLSEIMQGNTAQARALLELYGATMPEADRLIIERFIALHERRFAGMHQYKAGYRRTPWYQNLPFIAVPKAASE